MLALNYPRCAALIKGASWRTGKNVSKRELLGAVGRASSAAEIDRILDGLEVRL